MFTGLVTDVGTIAEVIPLAAGRRLAIRCGYDAASIAIGASIACAGCCLTSTTVAALAGGGALFTVDASTETLQRTTLGDLRAGTRVNLERSLRVGDELGGHIVTGHVDGIATVLERTEEAEMARFTFRAPAALMPMIAEKGSVALDGTSLTVNEVDGRDFGVNFIPHTKAVTTWGDVAAGDLVNLEIDTLARYVARLADYPG
jgi:riboflavin synthase